MSKKEEKIRRLKQTLVRVGVELMQYDEKMILRCMECGRMWSPQLRTVGRPERHYKRCPLQCNQKLIDLAKRHPKARTFPW